MGIISNFVASSVYGAYPKPTVISTSFNGSSVDLFGGSGRCIAIQLINYISGTPTLDGKIQESDDGSSWTNIGGATFTQVTTTDTIAIIIFDKTKRYLRFVGTTGGTSPSYIVAAFIAQSDYAQSFYDNTLLGMSIQPIQSISTQTGFAIDFNGKSDTCFAAQLVGNISGTGVTLDGKIQESTDGSTSWTDVASAIFTQLTGVDDDSLQLITFNRTKQYLRYVGTLGGSSHNCDLAAFIGQAVTTGLYVSNERKIRGLNRGLI